MTHKDFGQMGSRPDPVLRPHRMAGRTGCFASARSAICSPNDKQVPQSRRYVVADSTRTRLSSSAAGPPQNQHAVLMKSDLDLSGIHMLSWVLILNGGRGERARIGRWSTDKRARLSPQDNKQHYGAATAQRFGT